MERLEGEASELDEAAGVASAPDPIEQVRELLFGEARRTTEQSLQALDEKLDAMRADFLARFAALEGRLIDLSRETEHNQEASIDAIGSAIAQLGATVQNLSLRRKGG